MRTWDLRVWGASARSWGPARREHPLVAGLAQLLLLASPLVLLELARATPDTLGLERCAPDWIACGAAFAALRAPQGPACVWAAVAGILEDAPAGGAFGLGGARRALLVLLLQRTGREGDEGSPLLGPLAAAALAFGDKALLALELSSTAEGGAPLGPLLAHAGLIALATAVLAPLFWLPADLVDRTARRRPT